MQKENPDAASKLSYDVTLRSADLRYLVTAPFEKCIICLIDSTNKRSSYFGVDLALSSRKLILLQHVLLSGKLNDFRSSYATDISESVSVIEWLNWWSQANSNTIRACLLKVVGKVPDMRIEEIAIDCLDIPELRASAASVLARMGSIRCRAHVRKALESEDYKTQGVFNPVFSLVVALGDLRDEQAVALLKNVAEQRHPPIYEFALDSLAKIGTVEAANVLISISEQSDFSHSRDHSIIEALIAHGSERTVSRAIEIAKQQRDGPKWLIENITYLFQMRGWSVGEYYTHVHDAQLVEYLRSAEQSLDASLRRDMLHCFEQIDSYNVRVLLWYFANRAGTEADSKVILFERHNGVMLSSEALEELINRLDDRAVPHIIQSAMKSKAVVFSQQLEKIGKFSNSLIISEVKRRIAFPGAPADEIARLLSILGAYGTAADLDTVKPSMNAVSETVLNAADETTKRLSDPLRLAEGWSEMQFPD